MTQQSILVVDDEAPMRKLLANNLKASGYAVHVKSPRACIRPNGIKAANPLQGAGGPHMPFSGALHGNATGGETMMPTKTREKKASADKVNALQKTVQPSDELAAVIGPAPLPRTQVVSKIWDYIRSKNLQNSENRREILADDKLRKVFGKDKVTMFEMNKYLAGHLT